MSRPSSRGFTLVEMLVVIGIIAILAALLVPAVNIAIRTARNAAIGVEINQLATAVESYKQDKGDYPPNFRRPDVVLRHIRKCYPKADPLYVSNFVQRACDRPTPGQTTPNYFIDEGEALVFWLSMTDNDPRYPFLSYFNPGGIAPAPKKYLDIDESRLDVFSPPDIIFDPNEQEYVNSVLVTQDVRAFKAKFCQDTFYIYIDSRSYIDCCRISGYGNPADGGNDYAYAEDLSVGVRTYWSDNPSTSTTGTERDRFKPVNPTTFQIICAGQDGEFSAGATNVMGFPSGLNYSDADKDNITNFSAGKTLNDNIP
jgi:prepilin-type N-terminal cleavage/methylation domain-containing protein